MSTLGILVSALAADRLGERIARVLAGQPHRLLTPDDPQAAQAQIAFVSRDVTGLSTKHEILPETQRFYDAMLAAPGLRWVQIHSAGADRAIYRELMARGVPVATGSGANANVVAQSVLAGILALARRLPLLLQAQAEHRWAPLHGAHLPRDLEGQLAVIVGWGPIGQQVARVLQALGVRVAVARQSQAAAGPGIPTVAYARLGDLLPQADWLILACPLSEATHRLVDAQALARLPAHAHLVNVARGDVVDEPALVAALQAGQLAGAFLDVFAHEPLAANSPLWSMPQVIATPHSAGFADSNAERVAQRFLDNLERWRQGQPLAHLATGSA